MVPFAYVKFLQGPSRGVKRKIEVNKINDVFKDLTFNDTKEYFVQDVKDNNKYYKAQIIFMEESERKLDEAVKTRRQRVKSSKVMDTASESEHPKKVLKTKSSLLPLKKPKNLQEMKKYDTICAVKLEKIDNRLTMSNKMKQKPQNINKDLDINNSTKLLEKAADCEQTAIDSYKMDMENDFEDTKLAESNSLKPSTSKLSLQTNLPASIIEAPAAQTIEKQASVNMQNNENQTSADLSSVTYAKEKNKSSGAGPKILSDFTMIDCNKKIEDLEKQLKERKKTVEKYNKLQKDYEVMEKKYKNIKKKLDDSEKQVKEYVELNKELQRQLLEKNDAEKADSTKTMP